MSSLTIDEKLSLVQRMKNQDISSNYTRMNTRMNTRDAISEEEPVSTLKLRIFVCIIIFAAFFGMYKGNIIIKGKKVSAISHTLEKNMLPESLDKSLESMAKKVITKLNETK